MAYVTLMASLPRPLSLFGATQTPISRLKLDRRLRMLEPEDATDLAAIEDALQWGHLPISLSEDEVLHRARLAMADTDNPAVRRIIRDRLEMRTCVAALRRRRDGMAAPPAGQSWGYGRWKGHIARNWTEASFRLDGVFPWIVEADRLLTDDDPVGLERLLMQTAWTDLGRMLGGHEFDFEAVVIYVLRWNLVDRWVRYDNQAAADRFDRLVEAGLTPVRDKMLGGWPNG